MSRAAIRPITFRKTSGEWGIEGVNLSALPPTVYAALYKLMELEHPMPEVMAFQRQALSAALLAVEKEAHGLEQRAKAHRDLCRAHGVEVREPLQWERQAEHFRIAAGCMWAELQRLEGGT